MKNIIAEYTKRTPKSKKLYSEAQFHMPGGVSSPIRSFIKPYPFFVDRGKGSRIWDVDGNEYIDFNCSYGAIIAGHANSTIEKAVKTQIEQGTIFGIPHINETLLIQELKCRYPMMDMFRFTNSGSESTMYAVKIARAYTGRDKIVKMEGAYHGSNDLYVSFHPPLDQMGPPSAPTTHVASAGIPSGISQDLLVAPFNDPEALEQILDKHQGKVAAVLIEPVLGNCGVIIPEPGYLEALRVITNKHNVLLIFDEVKVGLRLAPGGAAELYGVDPDIVCLAKVLGGGMSLGAFGVQPEISSTITPLGGACHFGTYNGHPVALAAGLAVLTQIMTPEAYKRINNLGDRLRDGMQEILDRNGIPGLVLGIGSMSTILFTKQEKVRNYREAVQSDAEFFMKYYMACLSKGLFLMGPLWSEESFISTAHTEGDIDNTLNIIEDSLKDVYK
jgi:glutamate-1-semialdehyde 2,1-aminomutase